MSFELYIGLKNSLNGLLSGLRLNISNAENFNTPGYKYAYVSYTSIQNKVIHSGTETRNPLALGASMTLGHTSTDFSQGSLGFGTELDVAVSGAGFFILSGSAVDFGTDDKEIYTRGGRFQVDSSNTYITDAFGRKVKGFPVDSNGNTTSSTLEPIQTDGYSDIGFIDGGILVNNYQAYEDAVAAGDAELPEREPLYRLALTTVQNKEGLVLTSGGAYEETPATGDRLSVGVSGEGIYGDILAESLESSNVDVAKVALDMALTNRGFSAIQGVIDDVNKIIGQTISKLS